ncbi:hypothetical protein BJ508DRAFT_97646 [Ascobolus immersus RN42]|uniref:Uncharacterized protein n=1 Tax=Ascobolus immersus RN42 TaxID=1160509 RepID=A0A3N4IMA2_ASCIM|nr:hypothetical protein BJ508DRAFT_97646 [Ascobolus immersus RN42]
MRDRDRNTASSSSNGMAAPQPTPTRKRLDLRTGSLSTVSLASEPSTTLPEPPLRERRLSTVDQTRGKVPATPGGPQDGSSKKDTNIAATPEAAPSKKQKKGKLKYQVNAEMDAATPATQGAQNPTNSHSKHKHKLHANLEQWRAQTLENLTVTLGSFGYDSSGLFVQLSTKPIYRYRRSSLETLHSLLIPRILRIFARSDEADAETLLASTPNYDNLSEYDRDFYTAQALLWGAEKKEEDVTVQALCFLTMAVANGGVDEDVEELEEALRKDWEWRDHYVRGLKGIPQNIHWHAKMKARDELLMEKFASWTNMKIDEGEVEEEREEGEVHEEMEGLEHGVPGEPADSVKPRSKEDREEEESKDPEEDKSSTEYHLTSTGSKILDKAIEKTNADKEAVPLKPQSVAEATSKIPTLSSDVEAPLPTISNTERVFVTPPTSIEDGEIVESPESTEQQQDEREESPGFTFVKERKKTPVLIVLNDSDDEDSKPVTPPPPSPPPPPPPPPPAPPSSTAQPEPTKTKSKKKKKKKEQMVLQAQRAEDTDPGDEVQVHWAGFEEVNIKRIERLLMNADGDSPATQKFLEQLESVNSQLVGKTHGKTPRNEIESLRLKQQRIIGDFETLQKQNLINLGKIPKAPLLSVPGRKEKALPPPGLPPKPPFLVDPPQTRKRKDAPTPSRPEPPKPTKILKLANAPRIATAISTPTSIFDQSHITGIYTFPLPSRSGIGTLRIIHDLYPPTLWGAYSEDKWDAVFKFEKLVESNDESIVFHVRLRERKIAGKVYTCVAPDKPARQLRGSVHFLPGKINGSFYMPGSETLRKWDGIKRERKDLDVGTAWVKECWEKYGHSNSLTQGLFKNLPK